VGSLAEARRALAAARRLGRDLLLVTAPDAHASLGPAYLLEMMRQAGAGAATIDCGEEPGIAMLALRIGWRDIHLRGEPDGVERVAQMVRAAGGRFREALPAALDLAAAGPVDEAIGVWLAAHAAV